MKKTSAAFFSFFIYGIFGAAAYALMLTRGFEPETGFLIAGRHYYINLALAAIFIIFAAIYCFTLKKIPVGELSDLLMSDSRAGLIVKIIIGFFMLIGAFISLSYVYTEYKYIATFNLLNFFNSLFVLLSAISLLFIAFAQKKGAFKEFHYYLAMAPVLWGCLLFMEIFKANGGNPVLFSYLFQLLSGLFIMLSAYRFAALFLRRRGVRGFIFLTLAAYYFSAAFYGGQLISFLLGQSLPINNPAAIFSSVGISLFFLITASVAAQNAQSYKGDKKGELENDQT